MSSAEIGGATTGGRTVRDSEGKSGFKLGAGRGGRGAFQAETDFAFTETAVLVAMAGAGPFLEGTEGVKSFLL